MGANLALKAGLNGPRPSYFPVPHWHCGSPLLIRAIVGNLDGEPAAIAGSFLFWPLNRSGHTAPLGCWLWHGSLGTLALALIAGGSCRLACDQRRGYVGRQACQMEHPSYPSYSLRLDLPTTAAPRALLVPQAMMHWHSPESNAMHGGLVLRADALEAASKDPRKSASWLASPMRSGLRSSPLARGQGARRQRLSHGLT